MKITRTFLFLLSIVFLDITSASIVIPILPRLMVQMTIGRSLSGMQLYGWTVSAWHVVQFVSVPVVCALSDRYGRRPVLVISALGLAVDYYLTAIASTAELVFVARAISGLTASTIPVAFAYTADSFPAERRGAALAAFGSAIGGGFMVGPVIGGVLSEHGLRLPFWVAGSVVLGVGIYGFLVLPESLAIENRAAFSWRSLNPLKGIPLLVATPRGRAVSLAMVSQMAAFWALQSVFVLFMDRKFGWSGGTIGLVLGANAALYALVQLGLAKRLIARMGNRGALILAFASGATGFAVLSIASTWWMVALGLVLQMFVCIASPICHSSLTVEVPDSAQGQLSGALNSLQGVALMVVPLGATALFEGAPLGWIGAPIGIGALLFLLLIPFAWARL